MSAKSERAAVAALLVEPAKALALGGDLWRPAYFTGVYQQLVAALLERQNDPAADVKINDVLASELCSEYFTAENVAYHLRRVKAASDGRRVALSLERGLEDLRDGKAPEEVAQGVMGALEQDSEPGDLVDIETVLRRIFDRLDSQTGMPSTPTGLAGLDFALPRSGLPGGLITVVGAETSGGKSALANTFLFGAAAAGHPALCCAFEDSADSSVNRALAHVSQVDATRILRGTLETDHYKEIVRAAGVIAKRPVRYLEQIPGSAEELCAIIAGDVYSRGTRLVVVDYIQLVRAGRASGARSAREHIDYTLNALQRLARRNPDLAILIVSQFQRDKDRERSGRPPVLGDLKESSCIEQYAKLVLLVWRPLPANDDHPDYSMMRRRCMLLMRKNTEGQTGRHPLGWRPETVSYRDLDMEDTADYIKAVRETM